ncbi:hypothetical protein MRBLBA21_001016 [Peribacillus frigoritolerans]|uniref:hypothetical protein n=1 Tax=Peribacillus frigoritolerans TaxID=450367 RepID=UPI00215B4FB9|nr:hypothetical protein [Peribacillus frigoritolerans]MCR8870142.1 hypothetical protein [Peribacillus frigoritolerans]
MKENEEVMERKYECSTMITIKLMELTFFHLLKIAFVFWFGVKKMNKQSYKANSIDKNVKKEITS